MEEKKTEETENLSHTSRKWNGKILSFGMGLLALCIIGGGVYFYSMDHTNLHGKVNVQISPNATGHDIAMLLEQKGVIRSAFLFNAYARILGEGNQMQTGSYVLSQGLTIQEAIHELKNGREESVSVTIPEGYTVHQMAGVLQAAGIDGADDFEVEASTYGPLKYQYGPVAAPVKGEGFLFADTYEFPVHGTARQLCDRMYQRTDAMLTQEIRDKAKAKGMTLHTLITLASMVEREARFPEDQVPIASVMLKRLEIGMPLQIDATIQYVLGEPKAELTIADTRIDSPYNTYTHPGLPPGPIGSPGIGAIEAVLAAQPGDYLYYVAQADGHHVFTKSYEEHQTETENIYGTSS